MKKLNIREYPYTSFWMEEGEDILFWSYSPNLEIDISIAKKLVENRLEYTNGKAAHVLVDATNIKSTTKEARAYMSDPNGGLKGILGGAFLSNKVVTTVIVNLFFNINRPSVPARFFTDKEEALKWLKKIKAENSSKLVNQ